MYPVDQLSLDGRWLALAIDGADVGYVSFRAESVSRGLVLERTRRFWRLVRTEPTVLVEEQHWIVDDDDQLRLHHDGWDELVDDLDLTVDPIRPVESARWLSEIEIRALRNRVDSST